SSTQWTRSGPTGSPGEVMPTGKPSQYEIAVKQETTPGTFAAPSASDVVVRPRNEPTLNVTAEQIDLDEMHGSSYTSRILTGIKSLELGFSYALRGPGDLVTVP